MKTIVQTLKQHLFRGPLLPFLLFLVGLLAVTGFSQADDIDLFKVGSGGKLKPNIMVLFDNSGSMNNLIFPPFYDNSVTYSGDYANDTYYIDNYGVYNSLKLVWEWNGRKWVPRLVNDYIDLFISGSNGVKYFERNSRRIYLFIEADSGNEVLVSGNLLNFLTKYATSAQIALWNHFMLYGN